MTTIQAAELTAFIADPNNRAWIADRLISSAVLICPDCQQIADANNGCRVCEEARFEAQAADYDRFQDDWIDVYALRVDCNAYGY